MTITANQPKTDPLGEIDSDLPTAIYDYETHGHCEIHYAFVQSEIEALERAVTSVHQAGWPLVFAFVYDLIWRLARTAKLRAFVNGLIGPGYQLTITFRGKLCSSNTRWVGVSSAQRQCAARASCSYVLGPLTPATPDNGCIYVIERNSENPGEHMDISGANLTAAEVLRALPRVRALPAGPGSFLAWPNDTIHWGGMFLRGKQAGLALSFHFASANFENVDSSLSKAFLVEQPLPSAPRPDATGKCAA
jgi:hypothetical protein